MGFLLFGDQYILIVYMKKYSFGTKSTIFILFFGIALIEAFQKHNWLEATLFVLLGLLFIRADINRK